MFEGGGTYHRQGAGDAVCADGAAEHILVDEVAESVVCLHEGRPVLVVQKLEHVDTQL